MCGHTSTLCACADNSVGLLCVLEPDHWEPGTQCQVTSLDSPRELPESTQQGPHPWGRLECGAAGSAQAPQNIHTA